VVQLLLFQRCISLHLKRSLFYTSVINFENYYVVEVKFQYHINPNIHTLYRAAGRNKQTDGRIDGRMKRDKTDIERERASERASYESNDECRAFKLSTLTLLKIVIQLTVLFVGSVAFCFKINTMLC